MKFKHPCFVRVGNSNKRKQVISWLESIGYIFNNSYAGARDVAFSPFSPAEYVQAETRCETWFIDVLQNGASGIDCGTDIEGFKSLAVQKVE